MKMIKFPKIEQFSSIVSNIKKQTQFQGFDENDEPIMDRYAILPKVVFKGTTKCHGTNGSIAFNANTNEFWVQSRKNIITPEKDNAGFAFFVYSNEELFKKLIIQFAEEQNIDINRYMIVVSGEWAGKGIQKGVAITEASKFFAIFAVKLVPINSDGENEEDNQWVSDITTFPVDNEKRIFNIHQFGTFEIEIDFEKPQESQNKLIEYTDEVEKQCPAGKFFGVTENTIGEGIVWVGEYKDRRKVFKTKGEEHAKSKVKTLRGVDLVSLNSSIEFANTVCKAWRLEQGAQEVCDTLNGGEYDIKKTGEVIRWVMKDILEEELVLIKEYGLTPKQFGAQVSKIVARWFKDEIEKQVMSK